jgi:DNA-binding transcriptional MerR regulator
LKPELFKSHSAMPYKQPTIEKIYFTIGEVATMFDVNTSLIRFWEKEFDIIKPHKNKKGNRLFTQKDVDNFRIIYHLVKEEGLTLEGARKRLRSNKSGEEINLEIAKTLVNIKDMLLEVKASL